MHTIARYTAVALLSTAVLIPFTASAEPPLGWGGHGRGDIRHFDVGWWRGGRWHRTWHEGHFGWWWVVAGAWYFYPAPVYPYPNPYVPPVVVESPPQTIVVQPPPAPASVPAPAGAPPAASQVAPPPPPQAQYWYYCEAQQGYYPYVSSCAGEWKKVPATPPDAPG